MTIAELLSGVPADLLRGAQYVTAKLLGLSREALIAHPDTPLPWHRAWRLKRKLRQLSHGMPLAYVLGFAPFANLELNVNRHTLIPRPETELLAERAVAIAAASPIDLIVDVGTGSGCIPLAIASVLAKDDHAIPPLVVIDRSRLALRMAKRNARALQRDSLVRFLHGDLLAPLMEQYTLDGKSHVLVTANLPYLPESDILSLSRSVTHFEPAHALFAGADGLDVYRRLLPQLVVLAERVASVTAIWEIDPRQVAAVGELWKTDAARAALEFHADQFGRMRFIEGRLSSSE